MLGGLTALGVCAAVVFGGILPSDDQPPSAAQQPARPPTSATSHSSLADLYNKVKDGVAYVQAERGSGSGFVIDDAGHIVTNEHVVEGSSRFAVRLGDDEQLIPATLVGADASTDLAVLKVDPAQAGELHPLELADGASVEVGEQVIAIGSPFGLQGTLTSGIVSALDRDIQSPNGQVISGALQTDTAINPGNSGGPLLDSDGRVIGVNAQIASASGGNTGVGFAISVDTVRQVVPNLQEGAGSAPQQVQPDPSSPYGTDPYGSPQQPAPSSPYGTDPYGSQQPSPDGYGQPPSQGGGLVLIIP